MVIWYFLVVVLYHFMSSNGAGLDGKVIVIFYSSSMNGNLTSMPSSNYTVTLDKEMVNLLYFDIGHSSECSDQTISALTTLVMENLLIKENLIGLVGLSCSESAYALAQLIPRSKVSLKYIHTSWLPVPLADKVKDVSWGLLPPADILADACMALIHHANWTRVFAMYEHTDTDMNYIFTRFQALATAARYAM